MRYLLGSWPLLSLAVASAAQAQAGTSSAATPPGAVQELVVTARRPASQTLIDRKVYDISGDLQATTGSAADVLNTIPSVDVDADGNVSVRGDANVTVLVDGKPSAQFEGATRGLSLQQLSAGDIERIEVLTSPPAQFKAEGSGGVINIVTRKTRKAGFSGSEQASVGEQGRYVLGVAGAYNAGRLKLSGGAGLRHDVKERLTTSTLLTPDPATGAPALSTESIDEHFSRMIPSLRGGADYDLNDRQSIGASFSHRELSGDRYFDQHDVSGPQGAPPTSISDRHSDGHEWSVDSSEGLHASQKLWRPDETLTLALQRSVTREREGYAYRNLFTLPAADPSFDDLQLSLDLVKTEFSADYDLPLPHGRDVKLGYDFEDDHNAFDNVGDTVDPATGQPVVNPDVTNHFRYRQQVYAGYGQYQAQFGPWQAQAGVRVEASDVSTLQITGDLPGGRHDFGVYPSLHLDRSLGEDATLSAAITRRVTRPDPEALNPFADHQDTHVLRAGNPDLAPQDTWQGEVGYRSTAGSLAYGATAYYRIDRDSVTDVTTPVGADVVLVTKMNLPLTRSAGMEFNASGKLGRRLSYSLSGNLFYSQIDAVALGAAGLRSTTGLNLKASLDYRPTSADTVQVSVSRTDKRLTPQGYISPINLVNLGYRRQLRPDLSLVLTVSDVFDGQKYQRVIDTPQLTQTYQRYQIGRIGYVGFVYTFGADRRAKPDAFDYEQ